MPIFISDHAMTIFENRLKAGRYFQSMLLLRLRIPFRQQDAMISLLRLDKEKEIQIL